ncbi:MAG: flavodoxin [Endomicrobium sp.]|nr:flavodoxin [Endomicrobium sp.]
MSKVAVIYWSGTGNTEAMAKSIEKGLKEKSAETDVFEVSSAPASLDGYDKIAFGCPSMGAEVLEESAFEPYFTSVEKSLKDKKVALFGSYGWGDGQWMRDWAERARSAQAVLVDDGFIQHETPNADECEEFGKKFADFQ